MTHTWVIPYIDQPLSFWRGLADEFGDQIEEVYFPLPNGSMANGRSRQPEAHLLTFLRAARLPKAALVNPIVLSQPVESLAPQIIRALDEYSTRYGVVSVTITNLELARAIHQALPTLRITASCLMGISQPNQVPLLDGAVDTLTPDTRLTHDLPGLRRLRTAFPGRMRLLVNEACLPGCPLRVQHFYEMAYGTGFPQSLCQTALSAAPWLRMTGGWVLPQHLHYFDEVCDSFKLAGRVTLKDPQKYRQVLAAYIRRTPLQPAEIGGGPASPLIPFDVPDSLFETLLNCAKNCPTCAICRDFYTAQAAGQAN